MRYLAPAYLCVVCTCWPSAAAQVAECEDLSGYYVVTDQIHAPSCAPDMREEKQFWLRQQGCEVTVDGVDTLGLVEGNRILWQARRFNAHGGEVQTEPGFYQVEGDLVEGRSEWHWAKGQTRCGGVTLTEGHRYQQPPESTFVPVSAELDLSELPVADPGSHLAAGWQQGRVFAQIYVRGYRDSDGDGIGDLQGVIDSLDYLSDLGIGALWLMPISASADHDHGYAVSDYRAIEADYGDLASFDRLLEAAHQRGMAVILDYVINHSSSQHPLFIDARHPQSPRRDWYIWSQSQPSGWRIWGQDPWHHTTEGYYYGLFWSGQPDFNLRNPEVQAFHLNNLKFWLNRGVDGFRFDATGHLFENGPHGWDNQPENHRLLAHIRALLDQYQHRYLVCESPSDPAPYVASCGAAFAFGLQQPLIAAVKQGQYQPAIDDYLATHPVAKMGTLLSNHDGFAGERPYVQLQGDVRGLKLLAASYLTLPGSPYVYYGEELGMGQNQLPLQDHRLRAPMSWQADGKGFSAAIPFRAVADNAAQFNVEVERADSDSLLQHYRSLIHLRNAHSALATGEYRLLRGEQGVYSYLREDSNERVWVALNYADQPQTTHIPVIDGVSGWQRLYSSAGVSAEMMTTDSLRLPPRSYAIWQARMR